MDNRVVNFLLRLLIVSYIIVRVASLKCYSCHSELGQGCALDPAKTKQEECSGTEAKCYLLAELEGKNRFIQRGCTSGFTCPHVSPYSGCSWCDEKNLCNDLIYKIPNDNNNDDDGGGNVASVFSVLPILITIHFGYFILRQQF